MDFKFLIVCLMIYKLDHVDSITRRNPNYPSTESFFHHQTIFNDDDKYYKNPRPYFQPTFEFTKERDKQQTNTQQTIAAAVNRPKIDCPPGETGIFAYAMDCRQFLNCWRGIGTIQSCAPGTLFNSITNECDHPAKVKCYMYGELPAEEIPVETSARYVQNNRIDLFATPQNSITPNAASICKTYVHGLYAHPTDCAKFINCANGIEYIQDCGPGTAFNPTLKICDWPQNVDCSSYQVVSPPSPPITEKPYYGEGNIDMRIDNDYAATNWAQNNQAVPIYPIYERPNGYRKELVYTQNTGTGFGTTPNFAATTSTTTQKPEVVSFSRDSYNKAHRQSSSWNTFTTNSRTQDQIQAAASNPKESVSIFNATSLNIYLQPPKFSPKPNYQQPQYTGAIGISGGIDDSFLAFETTTQTPITTTTTKSNERLDETINMLRSYSQQASGKSLNINGDATKSVTTRIAPSSSSSKSSPNINAIASDPILAESIRMLTSYSKIRRQPEVDAVIVEPVPSEKVTQLATLPLSEALKALFRPYSDKKAAVSEDRHDHVSKIMASNLMQMVGGNSETTTIIPTTTSTAMPTTARNVETNGPLPPSAAFRSSKFHSNDRHHDHYTHHHNHYHGPNMHFQHSEKFHNKQWKWHQQVTTPTPTTEQPPTIPLPSPSAQIIGNLFPDAMPEEPSDKDENSNSERQHLAEIETINNNEAGSIDPRINFVDETNVSCDNGFDCQNGKCLLYEKVCDGRNDCGNRLDEQSCNHIGYEIRLSNDNNTKHMGRVEIKVFGKWGYVCDDKFGMADADVVCRELGFEHGAEEVLGNSVYMPNENVQTGNKTIFVMDGVECKGNETSLKDCDFNGWGIHDCNAEEVVGVVCKTHGEMCPLNFVMCDKPAKCIPLSFLCDGVQDCTDNTDEDYAKCNASVQFRLADGAKETEGRVEVRYQGIWGTVCDDDFGDAEAAVICRTLGFGGVATSANNTFGPGIGPIWLDQVSCLGNETNWTSCMRSDWGDHNCNHSEDISIQCTKGPVNSEYRIPPTPKRRMPVKKQPYTNVINHHDTEDRYDGQRLGKILQSDIENCGQIQVTDEYSVEESPTFRVISGNYAKQGFHPWQATLRVKGRNGKSSHWCGAVLISKYHLLTAAHCLGGFKKEAYFIRLGDHNSNIVEDSEVEVFIDNWFLHEDFRKGQHMNNDIALIIVKRPIQFTDYIQPICLPPKHTAYVSGMNCTISGWGSMYYGKSTPSLQLRSATVPIIKDEICKRTDVYGKTITDKMFCAGFLENEGIDACEGDSGGPLVCENNDINTLYGIISWGYRCGFTNKPGVYVKITEYLDWIQDKMVYSISTN